MNLGCMAILGLMTKENLDRFTAELFKQGNDAGMRLSDLSLPIINACVILMNTGSLSIHQPITPAGLVALL